jgi:hypothetical protein
MIKKILFLSLIFTNAVSAQVFLPWENVTFSNQSPGVIKVYGLNIPYYEIIFPGKVANVRFTSINHMNDSAYRIVTESGKSINYVNKGHERQCKKARSSLSVYSSDNLEPGVIRQIESSCDDGR